MPKRYSHHRKRSNPQRDALVILGVLLAAAVWASRPSVSSLGAVLLIVLLSVCIATLAIVFMKQFRRQHLLDATLSTIDSMDGLDFEKYIAGLLKEQGYTSIRLTECYDLGVDIIAVKDGSSWGIQVKRYTGLVKAAAVRQVVTALKHYRCDRAMVITNSIFSRPAQKLAESNDCILIDRPQLMRWMNKPVKQIL